MSDVTRIDGQVDGRVHGRNPNRSRMYSALQGGREGEIRL